jgi:hypothetical protein
MHRTIKQEKEQQKDTDTDTDTEDTIVMEVMEEKVTTDIAADMDMATDITIMTTIT